MNWIIENWFILLGLISLGSVALIAVKHYWGLPTNTQIAQIKAWLLWAVVEAEKELGGGTGKLKLRFVYDLFIAKFPLVAKVISFELFSAWVDEALVEMKELLATNEKVAQFVAPKE